MGLFGKKKCKTNKKGNLVLDFNHGSGAGIFPYGLITRAEQNDAEKRLEIYPTYGNVFKPVYLKYDQIAAVEERMITETVFFDGHHPFGQVVDGDTSRLDGKTQLKSSLCLVIQYRPSSGEEELREVVLQAKIKGDMLNNFIQCLQEKTGTVSPDQQYL